MTITKDHPAVVAFSAALAKSENSGPREVRAWVDLENAGSALLAALRIDAAPVADGEPVATMNVEAAKRACGSKPSPRKVDAVSEGIRERVARAICSSTIGAPIRTLTAPSACRA